MRDVRKAFEMVPACRPHVLLQCAVISCCFQVSCKADLPQQVQSDAAVVIPCTPFADQLVSYTPAGSEGGSQEGGKALGAPDSDAVSVVTNTVLSVAFVGLGGIVDKTGDDLRVHGTMMPGSEIAVYVGSGSGDLVFSGSLTPESMNIDIATASAQTLSYLQLVGISGDSSIDAFESLQSLCP